MIELIVIVLMTLLVSAILKFVINLTRYLRLRHHEHVLINFFAKYDKKEDCSEEFITLIETVPHLRELFNYADLSEFVQQFGMVYSILEPSLFIRDHKIRDKVVEGVILARGVFKKRLKESFSLIYWVQVLITLPVRLLELIGFALSPRAGNILSAFWSVAFVLLPIIFEDEIKKWFKPFKDYVLTLF